MMNFEDIQKNWQQQKEGESIMINADILLKEVKRNKQSFDAMIFWRDMREASVALACGIFFFYCGVQDHTWRAFLMAGACFFVLAVFAVDRYHQKQKKKKDLESLNGCIATSLEQINHEIKMLSNIFWWYILPIAAAGLITGAHITFITTDTWNDFIRNFSDDILTWGILSLVIWKINLYAVKKELQPRKEELETLLKSIESSENS